MKKDIIAVILANNCISRATGVPSKKILEYLSNNDTLTSVERSNLEDYLRKNIEDAMAEIGDITEYWDRVRAHTNIHQTGEHATVHQAEKIIMGNEIVINCANCANWTQLKQLIDQELRANKNE